MWRKSSYSNPNGECLEVDDTGWVKSSYSFANGNCVEWRKSRRSANNGACLEVAPGILVRDSKLGDDSPVLGFTAEAWRKFVAALKLRYVVVHRGRCEQDSREDCPGEDGDCQQQQGDRHSLPRHLPCPFPA